MNQTPIIKRTIPLKTWNWQRLTGLRAAIGGGRSRVILKRFVEKLERFTSRYQELMLCSFSYSALCEIKSKYEHRVPKYVLIHATCHPDGVFLS